MNSLQGKVALITGGAKGMGAIEAAQFVEAGAAVVISDVSDVEGAAVADALGEACTFVHHDVRSEVEWSTVIGTIMSQHGRLDVLVNNAGIAEGGGLMMDTTLELWQRMIDVNQTGVFLGMKTAAPAMEESGGGSIINLSSIAGLQGSPMAYAYGATKWAVRGITKSAAVELAPKGIRVNSVHPGLIDTDMLAGLGAETVDRLLTSVPMGRLGGPEEVGRIVQFLASDDSSYCTGQEFVVDGGLTS
jgi:3alpha(or 20beta)-hydroxysteroid dehydrogenase